MGWEQRRGQRYYYRKKRIGGRVVSEYVGHGEYAMLALDLARYADLELERRRIEERRELEKFVEEIRRIDREVEEYRAQVRIVVDEVLHQLGYRKYKGQWRKARKLTEQITPKFSMEEHDELKRLLDAAEKEGAKASALDKAKQYARAHPGVFEGTTLIAQNALLSVMNSVNTNPTGKVYMEGEAAALRRSLGEATATPLEKLLIHDVAICWVRLQLTEQMYSQITGGNASFQKVEHWERRLSAVRKRYLQSVETLARVRRLLSRAGVQINVAEQQLVMNA